MTTEQHRKALEIATKLFRVENEYKNVNGMAPLLNTITLSTERNWKFSIKELSFGAMERILEIIQSDLKFQIEELSNQHRAL